jgi:hypothetical protein
MVDHSHGWRIKLARARDRLRSCVRDLAMGAQGAREGVGDPYPGWHEATEGLGWQGLNEGMWRRSELDEKVLEAWRWGEEESGECGVERRRWAAFYRLGEAVEGTWNVESLMAGSGDWLHPLRSQKEGRGVDGVVGWWGEIEGAWGGSAPRTEEGGAGAWHDGGEAVKVAAVLWGAGDGRWGIGGSHRAKKAAGLNWDAGPKGFFRLKWEREKKKTGCRIEFRIYSKIRDSNQGDLDVFKPNLNWTQNRIKPNKLFRNFGIWFKYSHLTQRL